MIAVRIVAAILVLGALSPAAAQPVRRPAPQPAVQPAAPAPAPAPADTGFIGKGAALLEIDDCPQIDPAVTEAQLTARFNALYDRAVVLYTQGDYTGASREFIAGYCVAGGFEAGRQVRYKLLKDIGQAHERSLDYEKAIGYFERFVRDFPAGVSQADKLVVESRVLVLQKLRGQIIVETQPPGATVTISNESRVANSGRAGKAIDVLGGRYTMLVELPGYEPHSQQIEVRIGKPSAFFVPLRPLRGRLSVLVEPGDAKVFLRDRSVERFAGVGRVDEVLPTGKYVLIAEAADRLPVQRPVEVLPDQVSRMQIDLPLRPRFARRQLVAFAAVGAGTSTAGLLYAFDNASISALGLAVGGAAGLFGSYLYLPEQVPLGTSNLTITAGAAGAVAGITSALLFTDRARVVWPVQSATTVLGAGIGYYVGRQTDVTPGDAALVGSSVLWGTAVGGLFALSFGFDDREIAAGLILSGLGMGTASGVLMTRFFEVSRRRTILIDLGGLVGIIGGLAAESLVYPSSEAGQSSPDSNEHAANFMLGGVAVGLIGASILTRGIDAPRLPVKPAVAAAAGAAGARVATYGISGSW